MQPPALLPTIEAGHFFAVDMRVGQILTAIPNDKAKKPAYILSVDFGPLGIRTTSAQLTLRYTPSQLIGLRVVGWLNAPSRQIATTLSQFLMLGAYDAHGAVNLLAAPPSVPLGAQVC